MSAIICVVTCAVCVPRSLPIFFFNDTATTEIYTLSLHDALPISLGQPIGVGWTGCRWSSRRGGRLRRGHRVSSGQRLLWGHGSSLGPDGRKGLLTQPCACAGQRLLIEPLHDGRPGDTSGFTHGLHCSQQPDSPTELPLCHGHDRHTRQTVRNHRLIAHLSEERQTLLEQGACSAVLALQKG